VTQRVFARRIVFAAARRAFLRACVDRRRTAFRAFRPVPLARATRFRAGLPGVRALFAALAFAARDPKAEPIDSATLKSISPSWLDDLRELFVDITLPPRLQRPHVLRCLTTATKCWQAEISQLFFAPTTTRTMPPTSASPPRMGGSGMVLVVSLVA
jgi:hypothetical protein